MSTQKPKRSWKISRRGFLIGTGIVGGSLALGIPLGLPILQLNIANSMDSASGPPANFSTNPLLWFEITPAGLVRMAMPKVEMGQGIYTALAQIAADELELSWEQIEVVPSSSSDGIIDSSGTSASSSVSSLFTPIREAAATMREMLRAEAARRMGVPAADLTITAGIVSLRDDSEQRLSYGELIAGQSEWVVPETPPALKTTEQQHLIGQPVQRLDLPDKIRGSAIYGYDARMENMLYGAVARPPTIGAKLRSAAPGEAMAQPGVVQVVIQDGFAGVVAESRAAAFTGVGALILDWESDTSLQTETIEALIADGVGKGTLIQSVGPSARLANIDGVIEATYHTPMAAHVPLEPQAALADVQPDRVVVYASTQMPVRLAGRIAESIGRDAATVQVIPTYLGGGFGRKLYIEAATEAAILSAAVGRPVHVGWTRTEEFRNGYVRPPTQSVLRATLGDDGKISAIEHEQASGDVLFSFFPGFLKTIMGADLGAWRGARIPYEVPSIRTMAERMQLPIPTGSWRGLGLLANVFAVESFMDELAHLAGSDPLSFRLNHCPDTELGQRIRAALERVAQQAKWEQPVPAGRARGIACCVDVNTVVAQVAEISLQENQLKVHKVWAVVDPGLPINPDGIAAQTEGNIIMGLSSVLFEKLTIKDGKVEAGNFDRYPLISMRDAPDIEVTILRSGDTPFGMGEPPIGPIGAAVGNALFQLTGQRLRELPLRLG